MLELGVGADVVRGIGLLFWLAFAAALVVALWKPKTMRRKAGWSAAVVLIFFAPLAPSLYQEFEFRQRQAKARSLFDQRCKVAREQVRRKVDGVRGIQLLNVREGDVAGDRTNPNWEGAALPNDATGLGYVSTFLLWEHNDGRNERGYLNSTPEGATAAGYEYVDVKQPDGAFLRYRWDTEHKNLVSEPLKDDPARYAVGFDRAGQPEDRESWVAGVTIKVIDTKTGETLAERTSFSFEPGLGSTAGFRAPWAFAITCPQLGGWRERYPTRLFVDEILRPARGE